MDLQAKVAGLVPRPALDRLYGEGELDAQEFVTMLLAQGQDEETALSLLDKAHQDHRNNALPKPADMIVEPDLPEYAGPKRAARRVSKKGPELRGHPLD